MGVRTTSDALDEVAPGATSATGAGGPTRSDVWAIAAIAGLLAVAVCGWWFSSVVDQPVEPLRPESRGRLLVSLYDPPERPVEAALIKGDGQIFAALATDPLVQRPEQVRGPETEQAYRYQRMAYGWLGWAASGGQRDAVPWALLGVTCASVALLVGVGGRYLLERGADPRLALLLVLLPAVFIDLTWIGPEVLGTALALGGVLRWRRAGRTERDLAVAVACFAAAALCRETLLLVPAVLALEEAVARRWRTAFVASASVAPYAAWVVVLRWRIGAWPSGSVGGRLEPVPFAGFAQAIEGWATGDAVAAVGLVALSVAALVVARRSDLRTLIAAHLLLAATMGEPVWNRFPDFSRVLLPLGALSVLALAVAATERRRARTAVASGNLGAWSNVPPPAPSPMRPARTSSRMRTAG